MALQTTVRNQLAEGVIGEFYDDSIRRVQPLILESAPAVNSVGFAYTTTDGVSATVGGAGTFAGILVNPKSYANYNGDLTATLELPDGISGELCTLGRVYVDLNGVASYGDAVKFVNATGALGAGVAGVGETTIPNCKVIKEAGANGLAVIELTN